MTIRYRAPAGPAAVPATPDPVYFLVQFADDEEPEPAALAFFASRFSFSDLLAAVFEFFEPPLSLLAMATSSEGETGVDRITLDPSTDLLDGTAAKRSPMTLTPEATLVTDPIS